MRWMPPWEKQWRGVEIVIRGFQKEKYQNLLTPGHVLRSVTDAGSSETVHPESIQEVRPTTLRMDRESFSARTD
jgi:hypothetical protein